ncbi:MAG: YebC/PmpR family DNA-binding transcriptional regulator [Candidatus Lernaella stagnicola]|nr:YebC/PmpR family DNA-binding transcriptional regulator [Candidatus Lernaella stagnicola]
MSGHSKWSTIKRKKGAADAKRGRLFSKLNREILLAAKEGGSDPEANIRLRNAIAAAKGSNMPKDNIMRAIAKGTGEGVDGAQFVEFVYEGYGPGGVAVLVETISDNRNRTTAEVRHAFAKFGGNLGEKGCVAWMFDRKGLFVFETDGLDMDRLEEVAIENGAEDIREEGEMVEVICAIEDYNTLREAFEQAELESESADLAFLPQTTLDLSGKQAGSMLKLMETFEELDDVENVWSNFDMPEGEMNEDE